MTDVPLMPLIRLITLQESRVSLHCPVCACVGTGKAISNASWNRADCEADCEIAFRCYRARLYQAFKQRGGTGKDCKGRKRSGNIAAMVQSARLVFSVSLVPLPPAPQKPRK